MCFEVDKVILNPKPGWVIGGEREKQTNSEEKGLFMGEKQRFWGGAVGHVSFWLRKQRFGLGKGLFPGGKKKCLQERVSEP